MFFAPLWRHRDLILQLTRREIAARYRGSFLGLAWSLLIPLGMLAIYTYVFGTAFNARWGLGANESRSDFALMLFAGLIVHGFFSECLVRAPTLVSANANYVKKVVFPIEVLGPVAVASAAFQAALATFALVMMQILAGGTPHATAMLFPLVLAPLLLGTMGIVWFLSAVGPFLRDIGQITGLLASALLFLSPVFYPLTALPEPYRHWLLANPLTFVIEEGRKTLILGQQPDWSGVALYFLAGMLIALIGYRIFLRLRPGFSDVL